MEEAYILPRKPSALLRIAVEDCRKLEGSPAYELSMEVWLYRKREADVCVICMAGAIMAARLGFNPLPGTMVQPRDLPETCDQLRAVDALRRGELGLACSRLGIVDRPPSELTLHYERAIASAWMVPEHRAGWDMYLAQADVLEKAGY